MINADELGRDDWPVQSVDGKRGTWVKARPVLGPFVWRLKDAWAVLLGRAEAVKFRQASEPAEETGK